MRFKVLFVGLLLAALASPALAQIPDLNRNPNRTPPPAQTGVAVPRTGQPIGVDLVSPLIQRSLNDVRMAWLTPLAYGGYCLGWPCGFGYMGRAPWSRYDTGFSLRPYLDGYETQYQRSASMAGDVGQYYVDRLKPCKKDGDVHFINGEVDPIVIDFSPVGQKEMRKHGVKTDESGRVTIPGGGWVCAPFPAGVEYPGLIYLADGYRDDGVAGSTPRRQGLYVNRVEEGFLYTVRPLESGKER
ncbi:MAG: hypothetical protein A2941_01025 [Candidatus Yanofskybacteria bacterium RIFCSPLOWO2_01_FULL_49_17]|uniref:Uncharacterized protein n=1 Tax=Candidatus Yanofskybacteria bacterium RIFCSPLOWO2_01_FULL_49_17 TaxID=1802700 RepID=A0A1F8GRX3_9BACT|nr:MAG: hypothetical protein A2941_01025 [Candidatus Yanofskybacteria bacterium RIFCSPLOWO2_01_FULL_49_17]